jgi:hypothetical protein
MADSDNEYDIQVPGKLCDEPGCIVIVTDSGDEGKKCDRCEEIHCFSHLAGGELEWRPFLDAEYDVEDGFFCIWCRAEMKTEYEELKKKAEELVKGTATQEEEEDPDKKLAKRMKFIFTHSRAEKDKDKDRDATPICPSCKKSTVFDFSKQIKTRGRGYYKCRNYECKNPMFKWKRIGH